MNLLDSMWNSVERLWKLVGQFVELAELYTTSSGVKHSKLFQLHKILSCLGSGGGGEGI